MNKEDLAQKDLERYHGLLKDLDLYLREINKVIKKMNRCDGEEYKFYRRKLSKLRDAQVKVNTQIETLRKRTWLIPNQLHGRILRRKYIYGQSIKQISEEEHYSIRWIKELHKRALREYYELFKDYT